MFLNRTNPSGWKGALLMKQMKRIRKLGLTRRQFLQGTGATLGVVGLSTFGRGLTGCIDPDPDPPAFLFGAEMVGRVRSGASTIRLVCGDECAPSTRFRLLYDTVSRSAPGDYAFSRPERTGFEAHDPINFELASLTPGTRYHYRVGVNEGDGWTYRDEHSFVTQRPPGSSFRFCIAADAHIYPYGDPRWLDISGRHAVYANIRADQPDLLISMGDDICLKTQRSPDSSFDDASVIWNTTRRYRGVLDNACGFASYLPVNGNHEGLFGWFAGEPGYQEIRDAKLAYFPVPNSSTYPQGGDPFGRYGAFKWGDALFIWLDVTGFCIEDPWRFPEDNAKYILGTAQRSFLQNTLAANASVPWKFIFAHHLFGGVDNCLPLGYGRGNANGAFLHDQAVIQNLMEQYGVQTFFYGHDHLFSVSEANSVAYVCTGHPTSGCSWVPMLEDCYPPYLSFAVDPPGVAVPGHVRVDVNPASVTISYIRYAPLASQNRTVYSTHTIPL